MKLSADQTKLCFECGKKATYNHHVIPRSLGGKKTIPLCSTCHPKAHGQKGHWQVGELVRQAHAKLKAEGKWLGGVTPYGFELKDGRLTPLPLEGETIRQIFTLDIIGLSWRQIAKHLNEKGIPTKTGNGGWQHSVVKQILTRQGKAKPRRRRRRH